MFRLSDILKKAKEEKDKEERTRQVGKAKEEEKLAPPPEPTPAPPKEEAKEVKITEQLKPLFSNLKEKEEKKDDAVSEIRISPLVMKEAIAASSQETNKLYEDTLSLVKAILKPDIDPKSIDVKVISKQVDKIIDQVILANQDLFMLAFLGDSSSENYLFSHSINSCIYSLDTGVGLGYERPKLLELGIVALLHDIGMVKYLHLVHQSKKLNPREYEEVKNHPAVGVRILEGVSGLGSVVSQAVNQHHERKDGSGYPSGLKGKAISEYAQIIGILDIYESMTHVRLYRDSHPSLEAVREVLNNKEQFEYKLIKVLIERLGAFPVGSFVKLNNKEIAQVVKTNRSIPLRPILKILYGSDGELLKETRILDLSSQPTIYIKSEEKMAKP